MIIALLRSNANKIIEFHKICSFFLWTASLGNQDLKIKKIMDIFLNTDSSRVIIVPVK